MLLELRDQRFGPSGEGYFRFSSFAERENVVKAMSRIKELQF